MHFVGFGGRVESGEMDGLVVVVVVMVMVWTPGQEEMSLYFSPDDINMSSDPPCLVNWTDYCYQTME